MFQQAIPGILFGQRQHFNYQGYFGAVDHTGLKAEVVQA
jgi:hypothetical protein